MYSIPGTGIIRGHYKGKWNFCKIKFCYRKVEVEFRITLEADVRENIKDLVKIADKQNIEKFTCMTRKVE